MRTTVKKYVRRTKRGRTKVRRHTRRLKNSIEKNRNSTVIMFDAKKDKPVSKQLDKFIEHYEEATPEDLKLTGTDEAILLDDEGNVRTVVPEVVQFYSKFPREDPAITSLQSDDIQLFKERIARGEYVSPELKNLLLGRPPARVNIMKTIIPSSPKDDKGKVIYEKQLKTHDNETIAATEESRPYGKLGKNLDSKPNRAGWYEDAIQRNRRLARETLNVAESIPIIPIEGIPVPIGGIVRISEEIPLTTPWMIKRQAEGKFPYGYGVPAESNYSSVPKLKKDRRSLK